MTAIAACTDKGAKRKVNQDACCVQCASTPFGDITLAVVCDGVGGLSVGELASATVVYRFVQWFRQELPTLLAGMDRSAPLDLDTIQMVWGVLLSNLNETIQSYGRSNGATLGTTFTGLLLCNNRYLVGHVGDCRVYCIGARGMRQITEDQTLLSKKLKSGEITPQEAASSGQRHVILQSVGTEGILRPEFYTGTFASMDLFVLCCDGAYRKAEDPGIDSFFANADRTSDASLRKACQDVVRYDIAHGEKDNLTVVAVCMGEPTGKVPDADLPTMVEAADEFDLPTMVEDDEGDEDLPTMVEPDDDDADLPTMVEPDDDDADLPTMVEDDEADLPTMVEADDDSDLPTMVESDDEADLPTMVEAVDEADLPTLVEGDEA